MEEKRRVAVWCGLTQHHAKSARDLPIDTEVLLGHIWQGSCPTVGSDQLEPMFKGRELVGFGVRLDEIEAPFTAYEIRTSPDFAQHYANDISRVRAVFRSLGFTREAQLYVTDILAW